MSASQQEQTVIGRTKPDQQNKEALLRAKPQTGRKGPVVYLVSFLLSLLLLVENRTQFAHSISELSSTKLGTKTLTLRQAADVSAALELDAETTSVAASSNSRGLTNQQIKQQASKQAELGQEGLSKFLQSLPTLKVAQKQETEVECDLGKEKIASGLLGNNKYGLVWVRLSKPKSPSSKLLMPMDRDKQLLYDVSLISFNAKMINRNGRFKVRRHPTMQWYLTIGNVSASDDDQAYYVCQLSGVDLKKLDNPSTHLKLGYVGGAKLNVLVPPKIIEDPENKQTMFQVNEFEPFSLRCKVISEPQSQLIWKREDGRQIGSLDLMQLEQRNSQQVIQEPDSNKTLWIVTGELVFPSIDRNQAGAYLCIASNGIQAGVSQRMSIEVVNCRSASNEQEVCHPEPVTEPTMTMTTTTTTSTTTTKHLPPTTSTDSHYNLAGKQANQIRKNWNITSSTGKKGNQQRVNRLQDNGRGKSNALNLNSRQQQQQIVAKEPANGYQSTHHCKPSMWLISLWFLTMLITS